MTPLQAATATTVETGSNDIGCRRASEVRFVVERPCIGPTRRSRGFRSPVQTIGWESQKTGGKGTASKRQTLDRSASFRLCVRQCQGGSRTQNPALLGTMGVRPPLQWPPFWALKRVGRVLSTVIGGCGCLPPFQSDRSDVSVSTIASLLDPESRMQPSSARRLRWAPGGPRRSVVPPQHQTDP